MNFNGVEDHGRFRSRRLGDMLLLIQKALWPHRGLPVDEGVIKYQLQFTPGPALRDPRLAELIAWQRILQGLGLLGRDPDRYGGLAYGNLSLRLADNAFVISASQCADPGSLQPGHGMGLPCQPHHRPGPGTAVLGKPDPCRPLRCRPGHRLHRPWPLTAYLAAPRHPEPGQHR
jgi:hypothetical protein